MAEPDSMRQEPFSQQHHSVRAAPLEGEVRGGECDVRRGWGLRWHLQAQCEALGQGQGQGQGQGPLLSVVLCTCVPCNDPKHCPLICCLRRPSPALPVCGACHRRPRSLLSPSAMLWLLSAGHSRVLRPTCSLLQHESAPAKPLSALHVRWLPSTDLGGAIWLTPNQ